MIERVEAIEERLATIENLIAKGERSLPLALSTRPSPDETRHKKKKWIFVEENEVNEDMLETIFDMYIGKNFAGFREHVLKQIPFSLHVLGYEGDVSSPQAVIILRKFSPNSTQIKLTVQRSKTLISEVSKKYCELLSGSGPSEELYFAELGTGPLVANIRSQMEDVKACAFTQVECTKTICDVAQVSLPQIILSESDPRRSMYTSASSSCPLYCYVVNANGGKLMSMFATKGFLFSRL
tara:strand:+ start:1703 stop:2419 length:717 start_codon:yes stop_codon:yes gene_type:complete